MEYRVIIIGTDHRYQRRDVELDNRAHELFTLLLRNLASEHGVRGIAEECNLAALAEYDVEESTVEAIARDLKVPHRYCDPDRRERAALGISQENDIRAGHILDNVSEEQIQSEIQDSLRRREVYWLQQVNDFDLWPVLFVCGADHVQSFASLLKSQGHTVVIAEHDWGA